MAGNNVPQTPYATAMPFIAIESGGWQDEYDRQRLASYDLYDDLYFNDPTQYNLMLRGADDGPIYIPTAKRVINSLARYIGKNWGYKVLSKAVTDEDDAAEATPEQVALAELAFGKLFARERLLANFRSGIPEWLRRGDWLWMVSADMKKPEGRRLSVKSVDPRRYFPMQNNPEDHSRLTGQQLIEEVLLPTGDIALYVQTWLKASDPDHPDFGETEPEDGWDITYEAQAYSTEDFAIPEKRKALAYIGNLAQEDLPGIKQLPIYHVRNNEGTDDPFGRSELSGIESIISGINQSATDEDLALAFMGLGMYHTDSGSPVDEVTEQPTGWKLGPKRVVEHEKGTTFGKVEGIDDVKPFQDHVEFLKDNALGAVGLSGVALGDVGNTAFSGIALAIRFAPTADTVRMKNDALNGVLTNMFYDLKSWFLVYEGVDLGAVDIVSETDDDDLLPFDREGRWKELMDGLEAGIFTPEYVIGKLETDFGYSFPAKYLEDVEDMQEKKASAADPFATRAAAEFAASQDATDE